MQWLSIFKSTSSKYNLHIMLFTLLTYNSENKYTSSERYVHPIVHSSTIHISQDIETTQFSINK